MTGPVLTLIAAASVVLALFVLRGRTLAAYLAADAVTWALVPVLWHFADPRDGYLALIVVGVGKLALFSVAVAAGSEVRWSAWRAAAIAALVYAFCVPTQMRTPIDGDEPHYLLVAESIANDFDLDLANQYRDIARSTAGRPDLKPYADDPVGPGGEVYSRHEPFLSLLLVPGWLMAGLAGAVATVALFGVLLVRSTVRLLEDEGIDDATIRLLFPLFAFGPPVLFYSTRIWPEVPAAFFFVEAVRGVRQARWKRAVPALLGLVLLKLRFGLIGAMLAILLVLRMRLPRRAFVALGALVVVPIAMAWGISGDVLNVHALAELKPARPSIYATGFFGLLTDGAAGLLFQAPIYLLGVAALLWWKEMPQAFRIAAVASIPYLYSLLPRPEWHGGWSPPLRYIVVFMPMLLLGAAALLGRRGAADSRQSPADPPEVRGAGNRSSGHAALALAALWTIGLTIHGLAYSWRLFHIANGENATGEWLSELHHADFSRMFPSFVRLNSAAIAAAIAIVLTLLVIRFVRVPGVLVAPFVALAFSLGYAQALKPPAVVEFEDQHVVHHGGELYPPVFTMARFQHRAGWRIGAGESVSFRATPGIWQVEYATAHHVTLDVDGRRVKLSPTGTDHALAEIEVPAGSSRVTITSLDGLIGLDRMTRE